MITRPAMAAGLVVQLDRDKPSVRGQHAGHQAVWVDHEWQCTCPAKRSRTYYPTCLHVVAVARAMPPDVALHLINARRRAGFGPAGPAKNPRA